MFIWHSVISEICSRAKLAEAQARLEVKEPGAMKEKADAGMAARVDKKALHSSSSQLTTSRLPAFVAERKPQRSSASAVSTTSV